MISAALQHFAQERHFRRMMQEGHIRLAFLPKPPASSPPVCAWALCDADARKCGHGHTAHNRPDFRCFPPGCQLEIELHFTLGCPHQQQETHGIGPNFVNHFVQGHNVARACGKFDLFAAVLWVPPGHRSESSSACRIQAQRDHDGCHARHVPWCPWVRHQSRGPKPRRQTCHNDRRCPRRNRLARRCAAPAPHPSHCQGTGLRQTKPRHPSDRSAPWIEQRQDLFVPDAVVTVERAFGEPAIEVNVNPCEVAAKLSNAMASARLVSSEMACSSGSSRK